VLEQVKGSRVVRTARRLSERYGEDSGGYLAAAIAYYGFLSLFPLLLLALSVVGFVLADRPGLRDDVAAQISRSVPGLDALIGRNIGAVVKTRAGAGLIGLAGLLWTGTGAAGAARNAVRRVFRQPLPRGLVEDKVWLVVKTIGLGLLALAATGLAGAVAGIEGGGPAGIALLVAVPLGTLALDTLLFLASYWTLTKGRPHWRSILPGAVFAAVGWTILKLVGAWYATRTLENSSAVYGTFAATVAILVLLYLGARLFVYGAELNAVLIEEAGENAGQGGGVVETKGNGQTPDGRPGEAARKPPEQRSTVELVKSIGTDASLLVRKEIELAKQEVKEGIAARVMAIVALSVAGVLGLFALGFLLAAGAAGLDEVLAPWASRLVVGGTLLLLAGAGAAAGVRRLRSPSLAPVKARENIKEDVEWARAALKR
jgi:inner membrane protein YhjD